MSDGITVVTTGAAGRYTLLADPRMPAVFVKTPANCAPIVIEATDRFGAVDASGPRTSG